VTDGSSSKGIGRSIRLAGFLAIAVAACGGEAQSRRRGGGRLTAARLYPLKAGNAWSYDVEIDVPGTPDLLTVRVAEVEGRRVVLLRDNADSVILEVRRDGLYWPGKGGYLIKDPIAEGAGWGLRSGSRSRVTSISKTVETAGETFRGCVEVVLESEEQRVRTVYAPDVGPVEIEEIVRIPDLSYHRTSKLRGYMVE